MKKVTKFFMAAFLAGMCNFGYAQDYLGAPKANDEFIKGLPVSKEIKMELMAITPENYTGYNY